MVFLDPDFLKDAEISAICVHLRQIGLLNICMGFQDLLAYEGLGAQNRGRSGAILTRNELVLPFGGSYVCANLGENRSRNATVRVPTDGQIHTLTH